MLRKLLNRLLNRGEADVPDESTNSPEDVGGKPVDTQMATMMVKQLLNTRDDEARL